MDAEFYILVLEKLHIISVQGLSAMEEGGRYLYGWDTSKSIELNKLAVAKEDAALKYFIDLSVVDGERMRNEYRRQRMEGQEQNPPINVWDDWDTVDDAYREYEWTTYLYSINTNKLRAELERFGLKQEGVELVNVYPLIQPVPTKATMGLFAVHQDGSISYEHKPLKLRPEVRRLIAALLAAEGAALNYNDIVDALWNEVEDTSAYLDDPSRTTAKIKKRIGNAVSDANRSLSTYDDKKHIVSVGETSYKFVA